MLDIDLRFEDGTARTVTVALPVEIGRGPNCGLRLKAWRVARRHARIGHRESGLFIEDFGSLGGTTVNGHRVAQYGPLCAGDEIVIGPCQMRLSESFDMTATAPAGKIRDSIAPIAMLAVASDPTACSEPQSDPDLHLNSPKENVLSAPHSSEMHPVPFGSLDELSVPVSALCVAGAPVGQPEAGISLQVLLQHRRRLHAALLDALDLRRRDVASMSDAALRSEARAALADIIHKDQDLPESVNRNDLLVDVVNEAVGLGPLELLLTNPAISEIMVNRYDEVFIESDGRLQRHHSSFSSEQAVLGVIERIVSPLGRRIDESSPMVDARLRDGSRVNAVIAPIALRGASLTIRKFPVQRPTMDDLVRVGAFDQAMCDFLQICVASRKNIIVSGGTGSGKTTLLNILSNCIPAGERIVTIEDAAELRLGHPHLVALESRPANLEGRGKIDIRDLVRNALRMRPDRIVIGECRGGEAFDMLAAMNTGHEGSLTTLHANSARDALSRLETMVLMAGMDLPLAVVREHIAASVNLLVQQARLNDGRRLITSIVEVTGTESGRIQTQELFRYQPGPPDAFTGCGILPECFAKNASRPEGLVADLFNRHTVLQRTATSFASSAKLDESGPKNVG